MIKKNTQNRLLVSKRVAVSGLALILAAASAGCGKSQNYVGYTFPESAESNLTPVSNTYVDELKIRR